MRVTGAPELVEAASELQMIIGAIQLPLDFETTATPYAVSTPEWP